MTEAEVRLLIGTASPAGQELLRLFAEYQLVSLPVATEHLGTSVRGLNGVLGHLVTRYRAIVNDESASFYIYLPDIPAWAVSWTSRKALRSVLREQARGESGASI